MQMDSIQKSVIWLQKQLDKDNKELEHEKNKIINDIKSFNKGDLISKPKPISIWKRLIRVMGF